MATVIDSGRASQGWPTDLVMEEATITARMRATPNVATFPLVRLHDRFALTPSEERVLWMLIAHEVCPISRQMIRALATEQVLDPTTDAIRRAVYGPAIGPDVWRELGDEGALRRFALLESAEQDTRVPLHRQTWKLSPRVLALVHGVFSLDPALAAIAQVSADDGPYGGALEVSDGVTESIDRALDRAAYTLVCGGLGMGRRSVLRAAARRRGWRLLEIDGRAISKDIEVAHRQIRGLARECRLMALIPLIAHLDALESDDRIGVVEREFAGALMATASRAPSRRWRRAPVLVKLEPLRGVQHARLWARALPTASQADAEILAMMYPIAPAMIEASARAATEQCGDARMEPGHIEHGLRIALDHCLAGLATPVHVTQTWSDLVLSEDQSTAVAELVSRVRGRRCVYEEWGFASKVGRGLGVSALFSGPPGTGKTMTAGLVARELRVELFQVDTSKIVSKWIGETQQNLAALFDAAEAGCAVLLFDEADALFAKRTEVRSSNDRHANQEVDYLLQRLEAFRGTCILTTNHETAIDDAFRRRIAVHVRFQLPDTDERHRLWQSILPESAPRSGDLRLEELARRYPMSGGYIRNAALRAAFLAADEESVIDAARLSRAAQLEYEGLGKLVSQSTLTK
ncbi:MAG: ATP-binding protein [Deltaproteobacteria bacterium]|nr:ATP-binding protein [Deltaproteobacteria bacterium]